MDPKTLENQLKNCKIREGTLYKRSKFLKQWRERWVVLTINYLFTFTNKTCKQVTDIIDLKQLRNYKSYVRKDQQMIPAGFKISSQEGQFYFCGRNANEKWSWLVTLQRLMDYKYAGSSTYNNIQFIKTKGFTSQLQYQNGGKAQKTSQPNQIQKQKSETKKSAQQAKKQVDNQVDKIMKQLQNQKQQLKIKQLEFTEKEKLLKQQQQTLKKQQQERIKQLQKKPSNSSPSNPKSFQNKQSPSKNQQVQNKDQSKNQGPIGSKVSQLKSLYEQKMVQASKETAPAYKLTHDLFKNIKMKNIADQLHILRAKTVTNLFQEFHQQSPQPQFLKFTLDFLVKIASQSKYGYYVPIVAELKSHKNKKYLAEIFIQMLTDYKDLENCDLIAKFIQISVFQAPGFFNQNHIQIIKNKLVDFFLIVQEQDKIQTILKNMFIVNKMSKYQKNETVKAKLNRLVKESKKQENKNWSRKLVQDF